jgi:hypothetical protein
MVTTCTRLTEIDSLVLQTKFTDLDEASLLKVGRNADAALEDGGR